MNTIRKLPADYPSAVQIYLVLSQTGSLLSQVLKIVTGAEYNHISISLSSELARMYSFGRRHPYNPFWGGFVVESIHGGTFKRFTRTKAAVISVPVSGEVYDGIRRTLERMLAEQTTYHYDFLGLLLAALHIHYRRNRRRYCSEFVKELLLNFHIKGVGQLPDIVQPVHFLALPQGRLVFHGYLRDYPGKEAQVEEVCSRP